MDVDLGTVPIEQARIARHAIQQAIDNGDYWKRENDTAAQLMVAWFDYRIERAEFEAAFLLEEKPS